MSRRQVEVRKKYVMALILLLITILVLAIHGCRNDDLQTSVSWIDDSKKATEPEVSSPPEEKNTAAEPTETEGMEPEGESREPGVLESVSETESVGETEAESESGTEEETELMSESGTAEETEQESESGTAEETELMSESGMVDETESEKENGSWEVEESSPEIQPTESAAEFTEEVKESTEAAAESAEETETHAPEIELLTVETKAAEYAEGYELSYGDLTVTAYYSDGTNLELAGYGIVQEDGKLWVIYGNLKSEAIEIAYRPTVVRVTAAAREDHYYLNDTLSAEDFEVTVTYSDGEEKSVSEGVILVDHSAGTPVERENVVLCEFVDGVYMKNGYAVSVVVEGVESPVIFVSWHYRERVALAPEMLELVNEARRGNGLVELTWEAAAEETALIRARELTEQYSHERPDGTGTDSLYEKIWGENINTGTYRETASLQQIFDSWMASPGHRACILEASEAAGFVCAYSVVTDVEGYGTGYWVMLITRN